MKSLPNGHSMKDQSPFSLFSLFVPQWLLNTRAEETNNKAKRNHEGELTPKPHTRPWHNTTGTELGAFLGVLLASGLYKLPRTTDCWNAELTKPLLVLIQRLISLVRW